MPPSTTTYRDRPTTTARNIDEWRAWLEAHHADAEGVWLIIYKKGSDRPSITYKEAVPHALCYGWVDSVPNKRDAESFYQYFSPRSPKSNWSGLNKRYIAEMEAAGLMRPAGAAMVADAKASGTWDALNDVENLVIPDDLAAAFAQYDGAEANFKAFPPSAQRGILEWIFNAVRPATRAKRITETAEKAARNERANQWR